MYIRSPPPVLPSRLTLKEDTIAHYARGQGQNLGHSIAAGRRRFGFGLLEIIAERIAREAVTTGQEETAPRAPCVVTGERAGSAAIIAREGIGARRLRLGASAPERRADDRRSPQMITMAQGHESR